MQQVLLAAALAATLASPASRAQLPYGQDLRARVQPTLAKPGVGETTVDPDYGARLTRLTDAAERGPLYDGGHYIKADYSRVQAENADATQLLVLAVNRHGLLQYALLDPRGGEPRLIDLPYPNAAGLRILHDETEARWHPGNPDVIRFIEGQNSYVGDLKVFEYNWRRHEVSVLADLTGKLPPHWGEELYGMTLLEGEYSADGNRLAWAIENGREETVGFVAFDLRQGGVVLGTLDYDGRQHDNLSISPSGRHVAISAAQATSYFPVDFSSEHLIGGEAQHGDFCVTASGGDCYITVAFDDQSDEHYGWVVVTDLQTGERTPLLDVWALGNTSMHFSGRGFDARGWALMSTYNCHLGDPQAMPTSLCSRNLLVELQPDPRVYTVNWNNASGDRYYGEPHATMSSDASRLYFASDWMQRDGAVDLYRVDLDPLTFADIEPYQVLDNPLPLLPVDLIAPAHDAEVSAGSPLAFRFAAASPGGKSARYDWETLDSASGAQLLARTAVTAAEICLPAHCELTLAKGELAAGQRYRWRLRARADGRVSAWSSRHFTTAEATARKPGRIAQRSPRRGAELNLHDALTLQWQPPAVANPASAISHYELRVIDATRPQTPLSFSMPAAACQAERCQFTLPAATLRESTGHRWSVQAVNAAGSGRPTSSRFRVVDFDRVKPSRPTALSPSAQQLGTGKPVTLRWRAPHAAEPVSRAVSYDLILVDKSERRQVLSLPRLPAADHCDAAGACSLRLDADLLEAGKRYKWRLRARNLAGRSRWQAARFTTH